MNPSSLSSNSATPKIYIYRMTYKRYHIDGSLYDTTYQKYVGTYNPRIAGQKLRSSMPTDAIEIVSIDQLGELIC